MTRKINELRMILNNIPDINEEEEAILLQDLSFLKDSFEDALVNSNQEEIRSFLKSKIELVERTSLIVLNKSYSDLMNLEPIRNLYAPIFEEQPEPVSIHLSLDPSLVQDLSEIKRKHPYGEKYSLDDFIVLLLIEQTMKHESAKTPSLFERASRAVSVIFNR
ncbi:hypothetical protein ABER99_20105 [Paenibacillus glucanolyticus]|uniref:Uncharacterized protein n=1 Tax=Paenibacillus glucanolyticus TaxID=59843 RepID=A0A163GMK1_9BACL|nr:hypothetical protein [Paenibacillus glucanolyticus]KZS45046.1 hypothetical protein AWU65_03430 [Paenibacillus glucanolyticus]OMF66716.1 hypothetical protein BK142_29285 [Paenibacillus glucanolyticus]